MPLTSAKFVPYEMKTSVLKITSYDGKNPKGSLNNPLFGGERCFENLTQMLLLIDELQNELNFPQQAMEHRRFQNGPAKPGAEQTAGKPADTAIASFKLNILFRQNASWQGNIVWIEQSTEAQFRSALEMILLIDSVLAA